MAEAVAAVGQLTARLEGYFTPACFDQEATLGRETFAALFPFSTELGSNECANQSDDSFLNRLS